MRKFQTRGMSGFQTCSKPSTHSLASSPASSSRKVRREGMARRIKRLSLPAALQNTSVTARTMIDVEDAGDTSVTASPTEAAGTPRRSRRFSLVLSRRRESGSGLGHGQGEFESLSDLRLPKGVAANKLSELLIRNSRVKA